MPSQRPNDSSAAEPIDFEQALQELEQALQVLKARHAQVQLDQQRQQALQQRLGEVERAAKAPRRNRAAAAELKQLRQQLEELELALESQLFSWSGLREVFWQAVRFGGLGIVVGWVLKSLAG
jgi:DNA repair ATPase RecN